LNGVGRKSTNLNMRVCGEPMAPEQTMTSPFTLAENTLLVFDLAY
jgi:hypothetical protein